MVFSGRKLKEFMINYFSFRIVIHDNGELRLNLSDYRGAEYYASKDDFF